MHQCVCASQVYQANRYDNSGQEQPSSGRTFAFAISKANSCSYVLPVCTDTALELIGFPSAC